MLRGPATRCCVRTGLRPLGASPAPGDCRCGTQSQDLRVNCAAKAQGLLSATPRGLGTQPSPRAADRAGERGPDAAEARASTLRMLRLRAAAWACSGLVSPRSGLGPEGAPCSGKAHVHSSGHRPSLSERPGARFISQMLAGGSPLRTMAWLPDHLMFAENTLVRLRERRVWVPG